MFRGGRLDGLVVACTDRIAERLPDMQLSVTSAGRLYDRGRGQYVFGARVVERPAART